VAELAAPSEARAGYRFDPLDKSVLLGLGWTQVCVIGAAAVVWFVAVLARWPIIPVSVVFGLMAACAVAPVAGQPVCSWVPVVLGWVGRPGRARRWYRPLHLLSGSEPDGQPPLPPWLAGLSLIEAPQGWGAIRDRAEKSLTAVVPIAGDGFLTRPAHEQDSLLAAWGAVFTAFSGASGVKVTRVCWSDVAHAVAPEGNLAWLDERPETGNGAEAYRAWVAGRRVARHDQLLSFTVVAEQRTKAQADAAMDGLAAAVESLTDALGEARLRTDGPLSVGEIGFLLRNGLDPVTASAAPRRHGALSERLGTVPLSEAGPMTTKVAANHVEVDGSFHRVFWVAGWPERAQQADWLEPLLATDDDKAAVAHRALTVIIEPVPDEKAFRQVAHADVRLGSDAMARSEGGRRTGARDTRKHHAVLEREQDLVSGAAGLSYAGLVTLSAPTLEELDRAGRTYERRCFTRRVTLRQLWGRQDLGLAAGLPLGLGLSRGQPK